MGEPKLSLPNQPAGQEEGRELPDGTVTPLMEGASISRPAAALLAGCFIVLMAVPITQEVLSHPEPSLWSRSQKDLKDFGFQVTLQEVEKHLVYDSRFAATVRQPYQRVLNQEFGEGSRSIRIGRDGFLFHQEDIACTTGLGILSEEFLKESPAGTDVIEQLVKAVRASWSSRRLELPPADTPKPVVDSLTVFADFHEKLCRRGIHLVIVVVPGKSAIYPEKLWPAYPLSSGPAWNADYLEWRRQLTERGVDVLDLSDTLWRAKGEGEEPLFLKQDTHWSPRGVDVAATAIAEHVRGRLGDYEPLAFSTRRAIIPGPNDMVLRLGLRPDDVLFPLVPVELAQVFPEGDQEVATGDLAPVLLFGDSLTCYYDSDEGSPVGDNAGLAQQLRLRLNTGVQRFAGFGTESVSAIHEALARKPSVLRNKKIVVLELAMSSLFSKTHSALIPVP
jgi:alginate O-acetyltransferase complex protein AlgJ